MNDVVVPVCARAAGLSGGGLRLDGIDHDLDAFVEFDHLALSQSVFAPVGVPAGSAVDRHRVFKSHGGKV